MRASLIAAGLLLFAASACAQIKLRIEFPSAGKRLVWVAAAAPSGELPETAELEGAAADFSPGSFGPNDKLFVLDQTTGNLAVKPLSQVSGTLRLTGADFSRIGRLRVRVEHAGKPVETAAVTLKSGGFSGASLLDRSSAGEASFFAVPAGQIQVSVQYKTEDGKSPDPIRQASEIRLGRSSPEPVIVVAIPEEVATLDAAASGGDGGGSTRAEGAASDRERGGFGSIGEFFALLLAVAVAAAAVWFGLKWLKANQAQVQAKLQAAGVEVPGQNESANQTQAAMAPISSLPPEKIILADASPDPSAPAVGSPAGQPRLVSADGDELPLEEGALEVGREAGLGLSLLGESTVSRRHAEIVRTGGVVAVRDLGSTNGTFVNGVQVQGERELRPGDTVQFGAVKFRFQN
jgi:predicted component of type VI protein secretion system